MSMLYTGKLADGTTFDTTNSPGGAPRLNSLSALAEGDQGLGPGSRWTLQR